MLRHIDRRSLLLLLATDAELSASSFRQLDSDENPVWLGRPAVLTSIGFKAIVRRCQVIFKLERERPGTVLNGWSDASKQLSPHDTSHLYFDIMY